MEVIQDVNKTGMFAYSLGLQHHTSSLLDVQAAILICDYSNNCVALLTELQQHIASLSAHCKIIICRFHFTLKKKLLLFRSVPKVKISHRSKRQSQSQSQPGSDKTRVNIPPSLFLSETDRKQGHWGLSIHLILLCDLCPQNHSAIPKAPQRLPT